SRTRASLSALAWARVSSMRGSSRPEKRSSSLHSGGCSAAASGLAWAVMDASYWTGWAAVPDKSVRGAPVNPSGTPPQPPLYLRPLEPADNQPIPPRAGGRWLVSMTKTVLVVDDDPTQRRL